MKKKGASHDGQLKRLKRIEGQIRGLIRMVEEQRYCIEILTQIKAAQSALASVEEQIIKDHLNHCVKQALSSDNSSEREKSLLEIEELLKSVR